MPVDLVRVAIPKKKQARSTDELLGIAKSRYSEVDLVFYAPYIA